jgi:hypothetical protein
LCIEVRNLAKALALTVPGQPVFGDLRRCNGVEWKRGPVERFTGWRRNGAEWLLALVVCEAAMFRFLAAG